MTLNESLSARSDHKCELCAMLLIDQAVYTMRQLKHTKVAL
jgi:hypothetical protein